MNKLFLASLTALSVMALMGCSDAAESAKAKVEAKAPSATQVAAPGGTADTKSGAAADRAALRKALLDSKAAYEAAKQAYQPHASRQKDMIASIKAAEAAGDKAKAKSLRAEFKAEREGSKTLRSDLVEARTAFLAARAAMPQKKAADPKAK